MTPYEPGTAVTWRQQLRGGYGFVQPVDGVVVRSTSVRVIIRVTKRNGEQVERAVRPESLRVRREGGGERMTTTALEILETLNAYEESSRHDTFLQDPWGDVIWPLAGKEIDEEATNAADAAYASTVAVFKDGSLVRWLEDERRWVAEVPQ